MKKNKQTILILGGDGYLGWSLGLAFANRTDYNIILADNLVKRKWEKDVDAKLLVPIKKPKARIAEYERLFNKDNLSFVKLDLLKQKDIAKVLRKYRPSVVINAAQQPSAPFSMKSPKHAAITFSNNLIGHLNVLWSIAQVDKSITCIKLGSAGCYMDVDTDYLPLEKKSFKFTHAGKERTILNSFFPMRATDFYHQSKISDFLLDELCASLWKLKVITVQQATIFGATIPENHPVTHAGLAARFNYDSVFSTVMNRFVCQLAIGHPLTVYGDGKQRTGLISLNDTIENFLELASMDVKPGKNVVVHNYTVRFSIEEIAQKIAEADPEAVINYIKNPRQEGQGKLDRKVEVHKVIKPRHSSKEQKFQEELERMIEFTKRHKDNIDPSIIMPTVEWEVKEEKKHPLILQLRLKVLRKPSVAAEAAEA
jgi:UDP-sulfoquinovose synthase